MWFRFPIKKKKKLIEILAGSSPSMSSRSLPASEKWRQSTQVIGTFLLGKTRRQQMQEFAGNGDSSSTAHKQMNQRFALASANLAIASMSFLYPLLIWPAALMLVYVAIPFYKLVYKTAVSERRVSSYAIDALFITGLLFKGYFLLGVLDLWVMTLGRKWLLQSEHNSKKNIMNLFDERPPSVWVLGHNGVEIETPFEDLQRGDIIIVSAGQIIPVDGIISKGVASIDQYKLTGESQPAEKSVHDPVLASTVVLTGRIHIQTEKTGQETVAMKIGDVLNRTAEYKNSIQSRGEAIADRFVLPTLGVSLLTLPFLGTSSALAVLTNTFGYKMRLFAPASMLTFLNIASQEGILIKDGRSLELLNEVDTVIFDKTGTLTMGTPTVGKLHTCNGVCEEELLAYAAAAEAGQTHPVAKAILAAADEFQLESAKIENAEYKIGYGIAVNISDRVIRVGSGQFMQLEGIALPPKIAEIQQNCLDEGNSVVIVSFDEQVAGAIELHATIRPEAKRLVDYFHQCGISTVIISGDHEAPTKKLAQDLDIEHYFANTLPENKAALVKQLQEEGKSVCFVGDGINDSIALKQANVSVSLRGATTVATDTAQVVLMDGTLNQLAALFKMASEWEKNMKVNLLISTLPSLICLGGIFFLHWGVVMGLAITQGTLFIGLGNTVLPILNQKEEN